MTDRSLQPDGSGPRFDEVGALYRIATLTSSRADLETVINEILRGISDVVSCDRPVVFLLDPDEEQMRMHSPTHRGDIALPLSEPSIVRRVFHTGNGEVINDIASDPDSNTDLADMLGARQAIAAPLSVGDERLGVVGAINSKRGAFSNGDLRLLTVLADRAALTIEGAQLRALLDRQAQELEGLHRLSRLLTSTETFGNVIGESVRIVGDLLGCEKMAVLLYEEGETSLVAQGPVVGMDESQIELLRVPLSQPSLISTVYRTSTPLSSSDAANDPWVPPELRDLLEVDSLLAVPLATGPKSIGVLIAVNSQKGSFDDNDLRFATLLGGRVAGVIEAGRARERERALVQRLREADRTKTDFVSMLAHELKGPMTTIMGFSVALKSKWEMLEHDKRIQILDIIAKETDRLSRLVNDLLDVSRMEAGTLRYELEPLSLDDLVESILVVHPSLNAQHVVSSELAPNLPKVLGDKDRLRQVMINLLTNATRYAPDGTTITVSAEVVDEDGTPFVRVMVADEGIGIADEDQDRIFSKFSMLPKPAWVKKGTGLGLFITRGIVEAHGGRIWVESEAGAGSSFYFTLQTAP